MTSILAHAMPCGDREQEVVLVWVFLEHLSECGIHDCEVFHRNAVVVDIFVELKALVGSCVVHSQEANTSKSFFLMFCLVLDVWVGLLHDAFKVLHVYLAVVLLKDEEGNLCVYMLRNVFGSGGNM